MYVTAIVLWIVAFMFILIAGINIITRTIKTRRCTAVTTGAISDVKEKVTRRSNAGYASREYIPTVVYTVGGIQYSKRFAKAYNDATYAVGQKVEVMYNPERPAEINKKGTSNKADIVILCIGVIIGIVGVVLLIFA